MGILKSYNESRLTEARFGPGGNPKSSLPTAIKSRVDDLTRMTKIIASGRGLKFISNNAGLNQLQSQEKIAGSFSKQEGKFLPKVDLQELKERALSQAKDTANLVGSTLAQVPLNGTGTHLVHKFRKKENTRVKVFAAPIIKGGGKKVESKEIEIDSKYGFVKGRDEINSYKNFPRVLENNNGLADVDEYILNDLAPLHFSLITPETTTFLQFRAYITQFSDGYSSNWDSYKYLGRGENFYTYNTFDRSISLGFKIFAASGDEMKPLYSKIDTLASSTAPTYNADGYMRGTLTRMTVGGYVKRLPGFIESVNYSIAQDDQWDIGSISTNGESIPMSLDCTVNFKPIHSFIPQSGRSEQTRYVSQDLLQPIDKLQGVSNGVKLAPTEPITVPSLANIPRIKRTPLPPEIGPGDFGVFNTTGDESFLNEGL